MNFAIFKGLDVNDVSDKDVRESSAGTYGWADAKIDLWEDNDEEMKPAADLSRSTARSPVSADEKGEGVQDEHARGQTPISKPPIVSWTRDLEERERRLHQQEVDNNAGRATIGIYNASELHKVLGEQWQEVVRDRREATRENKVASLHVLEKEKGVQQQQLLNVWKRESEGWHQIECVLDSGAADSVCPKDMCPHFPVEDSDASRAGVYYTGANVGKLFNLGQTHVPIALNNGARTLATFQVADVSRPLMSVSKVCEMGNRVVFGANGGYILNLETGATTEFVQKDGIYIFAMWVPPLSESLFGRPQ